MTSITRKPVVSEDAWKPFFTVVFGTWMAIWLYAALHNQYLIRIAPEHFTVWHYQMPFFTSYTLLGVAYAFAASFSPGMFLGVCLYVSGRLFNRPKFTPRELIFRTFWVWVAVEVCSIIVGLTVWHFKRGIYPDWVYPDDSLGILITQSIQITAYLSGAIFSVILIILTWTQRKHLTNRLN